MLFNLIPKDEDFQDIFSRSAKNVVAAAQEIPTLESPASFGTASGYWAFRGVDIRATNPCRLDFHKNLSLFESGDGKSPHHKRLIESLKHHCLAFHHFNLPLIFSV
jgi:hypothetical protein